MLYLFYFLQKKNDIPKEDILNWIGIEIEIEIEILINHIKNVNQMFIIYLFFLFKKDKLHLF